MSNNDILCAPRMTAQPFVTASWSSPGEGRSAVETAGNAAQVARSEVHQQMRHAAAIDAPWD